MADLFDKPESTLLYFDSFLIMVFLNVVYELYHTKIQITQITNPPFRWIVELQEDLVYDKLNNNFL